MGTAQVKIEELTAEQMTSSKFYEKLCESEAFRDPLTRGEYEFRLLQRAKELKIKSHVDSQLKAVKSKIISEEKKKRQSVDGVTNFEPDITGKAYENLYCGRWIATEDGIESVESSRANQIACYHPILPIKRMQNMETSEEQITLAFKRGSVWNEITVPKEVIANSRSITALAKYGVSVTSETAKLLVKYLADVENYNDDKVLLFHSSSKLGWHGNNVFLPYDKMITFDAEMKFQQVFQSIKESGSYDIWLEHVKKIRAAEYIEPRIALAASFASVIIEPLGMGASPIVDFWGMTEAGKTVMLMLATSVWACPDEGQYMGDFMTTDVALEVKADMLNNLPLVLDDTAKMRKGIRDNIEQVIYNLASGAGKGRSNKDLGNDRNRTWKNTVIVNGERPLSSFAGQGGALNRIIEVGLSEERLFDDPSQTADIVRSNYGFAGKIFVEYLKTIDRQEIKRIYKSFTDQLSTSNSMAKQVASMAVILTADKYATESIFNDSRGLTVEDVNVFLTDRQEVSDGSRCYEYLMGILEEKGQHFDAQHDNLDQWGWVEYKDGERIVNFFPTALDRILTEAGFSRKSFVSWAKREELLIAANDKSQNRFTRTVRRFDEVMRVFSVKKVEDLSEYLSDRRLFD